MIYISLEDSSKYFFLLLWQTTNNFRLNFSYIRKGYEALNWFTCFVLNICCNKIVTKLVHFLDRKI